MPRLRAWFAALFAAWFAAHCVARHLAACRVAIHLSIALPILAAGTSVCGRNVCQANMKLFTKGLLLIALPSVVELALLGVVFDTQEQTARAVQSAADSKQILYQASALDDPLLRQAARVRT